MGINQRKEFVCLERTHIASVHTLFHRTVRQSFECYSHLFMVWTVLCLKRDCPPIKREQNDEYDYVLLYQKKSSCLPSHP